MGSSGIGQRIRKVKPVSGTEETEKEGWRSQTDTFIVQRTIVYDSINDLMSCHCSAMNKATIRERAKAILFVLKCHFIQVKLEERPRLHLHLVDFEVN